ncbi:unnamed protein product [Hymenolepis diminuta]|uniref:CKLF-like MARVEL transmembrane domain-containing protein 6 n=1 Tax=Hymenolepis diminuta TaxID=6216 RepID=A0A0R3SC03_HYMDI|nr:unnamed protein product [Hymenolepis diminuta]
MSKKKTDIAEEIVKRASAYIPAFEDVFTEEGFYIFFTCLAVTTFLIVFACAYFFDVTITDAGDFAPRSQIKKPRKKKLPTYSG